MSVHLKSRPAKGLQDQDQGHIYYETPKPRMHNLVTRKAQNHFIHINKRRKQNFIICLCCIRFKFFILLASVFDSVLSL